MKEIDGIRQITRLENPEEKIHLTYSFSIVVVFVRALFHEVVEASSIVETRRRNTVSGLVAPQKMVILQLESLHTINLP